MTSVLIPRSLTLAMQEHSIHWPKGKERGGILLGFRKVEALQITSLTFPGPWDSATATRFFRSNRAHRMRAIREWLRSGMTIDWVGEWHTHPGSSASPSSVDQSSWRAIAKSSNKPMAYVILSDAEMYVGIQFPGAREAQKLHQQEQDEAFVLFG
ncbi:Mov34/MPN/PAD-1 family protein [Methylobacterium sp. GXF4]|uniref:Mov34/MPN/PAD-1 family protein n=1 Tax=Methylobacterium sp. GXF4 TaxID=1096546 RepID=UPI0009DACE98|nr:Mov34/MPN/PAD-1 family protein [Methylobacterium sp. GXF4]